MCITLQSDDKSRDQVAQERTAMSLPGCPPAMAEVAWTLRLIAGVLMRKEGAS